MILAAAAAPSKIEAARIIKTVWGRACGVARRVIEGSLLTLGSLRLAVQDVALSRRKQGFDSPRERQIFTRAGPRPGMTVALTSRNWAERSSKAVTAAAAGSCSLASIHMCLAVLTGCSPISSDENLVVSLKLSTMRYMSRQFMAADSPEVRW